MAWIRVMAVEKPRTGHIPNILEVDSTGINKELDLCKVRGFLGLGFE